jgi:hypothetical protein
MKKNLEWPAIDPAKVTDKFSDNAGDNALTRYEIDQSIVAPEFANEHSFIEALEKELPKETSK